MKRIMPAIAALLMLASAGWGKGPAKGDHAPAFTLPSLDGRRVSLQDYRGRVVLLSFWATWNGPSVGALNGMKSAEAAFAKQGLSVLAISIDTRPTAEVRAFAQQNGIHFAVLHDAQRRAAAEYAASSIPMTFLIDRNGTIRYINLGYQPDGASALNAQIRALL